ncbi:hypothetical protein [Ponticaulis profundi]|uniref:Lipoprotein n=1 Tax=Ponticaulis profundi TaxID=2665222 RepID=A0ABW1S6C1_9PROT
MLRKILLGTALVLTACGGSEEETPSMDVAMPGEEPTTTAPTEASTSQPTASEAEIATTWEGADLVASDFVGVEMTEEGALLTRLDEADAPSTGLTGGAHVPYALSETKNLSGFTLRVSVEAKAAGGAPGSFGAAYSTNKKGNSGWYFYEAGQDFETFSFDFTIPYGDSENTSYIGVAPDAGSELIVKQISVEAVQPE